MNLFVFFDGYAKYILLTITCMECIAIINLSIKYSFIHVRVYKTHAFD